MKRRIFSLLTAAMCTFVTATVQAADTRVAVHDFHGPSADRLRDDVVSLLERQSSVTIISQGQLESSAKRLGVDTFTPEGRMALARELQISAWMEGVVKRRSGELRLTVVVYDGAQHSLVGQATLSGRTASRLSSEIREHLWRKSRRAIMDATELSATSAPPPAPQAVDTEKPEPVALSTSSSASSSKTDSAEEQSSRDDSNSDWLHAFLGIGSPYRSLAFNDRITQTLGDYQLSGAPMVDISLAVQPARPFTDSWISWLGLDVRAQIAGSTPTTDRDGNQFTSNYSAYHVGLMSRIPAGVHYVTMFSGYAMNRFGISPDTRGIRSPTPSIDYRMIRTGVGAEFALSDTMRFGLDGAWLHLLSVGEIGTWFPRATGAGLEIAMFATYNLTQRVFARASAAYQRAFFDFNPRPGDQNVAGGATDQYLSMSVGAGVIL